MFQGLSQLYTLDLEGNQLSTVDDGAWADLRSLNHLDISNNQLRELEPATFRNSFLPSAANNRVMFVCSESMFRPLSSNNIARFAKKKMPSVLLSM